MAVLEPLKVTISNFPASHSGSVTVPNFPSDEKRGSHTVPFTSTIYIEKSDYREVCVTVWDTFCFWAEMDKSPWCWWMHTSYLNCVEPLAKSILWIPQSMPDFSAILWSFGTVPFGTTQIANPNTLFHTIFLRLTSVINSQKHKCFENYCHSPGVVVGV